MTSSILSDDAVAESDEIREGIIVDHSKEGKVVSIEILDASEKVADPKGIQYEIKSQKVA
ncbi:MAG: DUF2283 domain-containing protein [Nitrospirota bacterium]